MAEKTVTDMDMNPEVEQMLSLRTVRAQQLAIVLMERLPDMPIGEAQIVIASLLMDAYRDGGRDMHGWISKQMMPLWEAAGLTKP